MGSLSQMIEITQHGCLAFEHELGDSSTLSHLAEPIEVGLTRKQKTGAFAPASHNHNLRTA
jgi:hypothetical protein